MNKFEEEIISKIAVAQAQFSEEALSDPYLLSKKVLKDPSSVTNTIRAAIHYCYLNAFGTRCRFITTHLLLCSVLSIEDSTAAQIIEKFEVSCEEMRIELFQTFSKMENQDLSSTSGITLSEELDTAIAGVRKRVNDVKYNSGDLLLYLLKTDNGLTHSLSELSKRHSSIERLLSDNSCTED